MPLPCPKRNLWTRQTQLLLGSVCNARAMPYVAESHAGLAKNVHAPNPFPVSTLSLPIPHPITSPHAPMQMPTLCCHHSIANTIQRYNSQHNSQRTQYPYVANPINNPITFPHTSMQVLPLLSSHQLPKTIRSTIPTTIVSTIVSMKANIISNTISQRTQYPYVANPIHNPITFPHASMQVWRFPGQRLPLFPWLHLYPSLI